jgi:hypothetical protein
MGRYITGISSGGAFGLRAQEFTSNGTWTCPADVTQVWVTGCGGGGGAGGREDDTQHGGTGGGGGGQSVYKQLLTVVPATSYTVTIGNGGNAGITSAASASVTSGSAGGSTSFGALLTLAGGGGGGRATGASTGVGGIRGGNGASHGQDGFAATPYGAEGDNAVHGEGGTSFPGGYGCGGSYRKSAGAGNKGYLLVEWNE